MPGNQGGANWGMTSANPTNGSVYVISFNFPTLIKLLPAGPAAPAGRRAAAAAPQGPGAGLYATNCAMCHGADSHRPVRHALAGRHRRPPERRPKFGR